MKRLYTLFLNLSILPLLSQVSVKDSSIATPMIGISYAYQMPGGDMVARFGQNSHLQLNVDFKGHNNMIIGINGGYLFGGEVKENIFSNIANKDGSITNREGGLADIRLYERGFNVSATLGYLIHFKKPNPNSGVRFDLGFGFIQHKIRIETIGNNVPQLDKQYKKGYDRLTNGFLFSENVGYMYLSNNRLLNLYIGIESWQGFTQNRRSYNFDTMEHDGKHRIDILSGIRLVWILPLYRKAPSDFYTH